MSNFECNCLHCGRKLSVAEALRGQVITCPVCHGQLQVPAANPESRPPDQGSRLRAMFQAVFGSRAKMAPPARHRTCPACGGDMLATISKCRNCGFAFTARKAPFTPQSDILGLAILCLPLLTATLAWYRLRDLLPVDAPVTKLYCMVALTLGLTALLVSFEARAVGAGTRHDVDARGRRRRGPLLWFAAVVGLWVWALPAWMHQRSRYGLRNLCFAGILVALLFTGAVGFMTVAFGHRDTAAALTSGGAPPGSDEFPARRVP